MDPAPDDAAPVIRDFSAGDDVVALTELLHRAYAIQAARGLRFLATHQTPEVTAQRIASGRCLVIELGGRIIGTLTMYQPDLAETVPEYRAPGTFRFGMFGIEPEFRRRGFGRLLHDRMIDLAREAGARFMALDTAAPATDLIATYERWGYRVVNRVQWPETNYESVVMLRSLE